MDRTTAVLTRQIDQAERELALVTELKREACASAVDLERRQRQIEERLNALRDAQRQRQSPAKVDSQGAPR